MRKILGCLAIVLGAISIALTARYGWSQADEEIDRYIAATLFGAISLCAFVFDGLAVRLWSKHRRAAIRKLAEPSIVGTICGEKDGHQYRWVEHPLQ
jgi:predicted benzoate:H+ symporter BenE